MMQSRNGPAKALAVIAVLMLMLSGLNVGGAMAAAALGEDEAVSYDENNNPYRAGQLIVGYRRTTPAESKMALRAQMQLELLKNLDIINGDVVRIKNERALEVLSQMKKNPTVAFAEYDYLASIDYVPNDPYYAGQLYLPYMNTPVAWDHTKGAADVAVAVLDTGILIGNTDLKHLEVTGYNFVEDTADFTDDHGHGTAVSSVMAAEMNNGFGIAGIAPGSEFMAVKVVSSTGSGSYSDMIRGIEYAANNGAKVINMSMGGRVASDALKLAVDNVVAKGVTIVAAAGNEGTTSLSYPAAYSNVIGVGAVDLEGDKMTYSNTGEGLTVMAGGTARVATFTDYITFGSGTSYASPYVAGMVALMYAVDSSMDTAKVLDILSRTSMDLGSSGYDTTFGYGVVNMGEAVRLAFETSGEEAPPPPAVEPEPEPAPAPETEPDTTPPVVTLLGDSYIGLDMGGSYDEPGATAIDDVDGDISDRIKVEGAVDTSAAGIYELEYSAVDSAGNVSNIATRTVEVFEVLEIAPETVFIRDVEVLEGSLSKKSTEHTHVIAIENPGQLDVALSYIGKAPPELTITGLEFVGPASTYTLEPGNYTMTLRSDSNVKYSVTLTYPEREVPAGTPAGPPEVILYEEEEGNGVVYVFIGIALAIVAAILIRKRYLTHNNA